jgi:ribose transport system permease protein
MTQSISEPEAVKADGPGLAPAPSRGRRIASALSFQRVGAVYVLILACVYFSIAAPVTFPTIATVQQILNGNAVAALAALALIIPLSAGVFDLSVPYTMSLCGVLAANILLHTELPLIVAIILSLLAAVVVGLINGFVVVVLRIESLIGTLATGALILSGIHLITGGNTVTSPKLQGDFAQISGFSLFGLITAPVGYVIILAFIIWFVQSRTATGRRLYAIGFDIEASRLAGIRTDSLRFSTLIVSALIGGIAGIVLTSTVGSAQPNGGVAYLLPAFAAVFLGATQLKPGRFNAWGTLLAVLLLGTGLVGLALQGAPQWAQSAFTGVVLIAALAGTSRARRTISRRKDQKAPTPSS